MEASVRELIVWLQVAALCVGIFVAYVALCLVLGVAVQWTERRVGKRSVCLACALLALGVVALKIRFGSSAA